MSGLNHANYVKRFTVSLDTRAHYLFKTSIYMLLCHGTYFVIKSVAFLNPDITFSSKPFTLFGLPLVQSLNVSEETGS